MWGMGDVKPRIEGIVQCTKRYCTILSKLKVWGGVGGAIFEPKALSMYLKNTKSEKMDRARIRTRDLRVRKTCFLIH